ncbi:GapS4b family protein [Aquimarina sp. 2201CG14-23]|uniref:GapS4b family protein n=1 Tax=Aquimarina mycalae TaxID=3040073 RepID=UPI002477CEE1|nr:hypothetical protein [Aquimarina sp. 2201CG14-23]MDH7448410.1 hypothetical protein [Aquimarina sp. 2201CG14-23]
MEDNSSLYQLPYGELIRTVLVKPELTENDLKKVIKSKGIFLSKYNKDKIVPELMCTLLSPDEYKNILEFKKNKEEKEKYRTASIPWKGDTNLLKSIPQTIKLHQILEEMYTYKSGMELIGIPSFKKVDGRQDKVELDFEIKEHSEIKDIHNKERKFRGGIVYELKNDGHLHLSVTKTFSSKGTQKLVDTLNKQMENHFKETNSVNREDTFERILFSQFINEDRFLFFMKFLDNIDFLEFSKVENISVSPDSQEDLPDDAKEFLKDIENLNLKGNVLRRHVLLSKLEYRKCIHLHSMIVKYKFNHAQGSGNCSVEFAFPDFKLNETDNLEFQFYTMKISIDRNYRDSANRKKIERAIFESLNAHKIYHYNTLKI